VVVTTVDAVKWKNLLAVMKVMLVQARILWLDIANLKVHVPRMKSVVKETLHIVKARRKKDVRRKIVAKKTTNSFNI